MPQGFPSQLRGIVSDPYTGRMIVCERDSHLWRHSTSRHHQSYVSSLLFSSLLFSLASHYTHPFKKADVFFLFAFFGFKNKAADTGATPSVIAPPPTGMFVEPDGIALDTQRNMLYIAHLGTKNVAVYEGTNNNNKAHTKAKPSRETQERSDLTYIHTHTHSMRLGRFLHSFWRLCDWILHERILLSECELSSLLRMPERHLLF